MEATAGNISLTEVKREGITQMFEGFEAMNVSDMDRAKVGTTAVSKVEYGVDFTEPTIQWGDEDIAQPQGAEGVGGMTFAYKPRILGCLPTYVNVYDEEQTVRNLVNDAKDRQMVFMKDRLHKIFTHNLGVQHPKRVILSSGDARGSILNGGKTSGKIVTGTRSAFTSKDILDGVTLMDRNSTLGSTAQIYGIISREALVDLYNDSELRLSQNTGQINLMLQGKVHMIDLLGVKWFLKTDSNYGSPVLYGEMTEAIVESTYTAEGSLPVLDTRISPANVGITAKSCGAITLWRKSAITQIRGRFTSYLDQPTARHTAWFMKSTIPFGVTRKLGFEHIGEEAGFGYENDYVDTDVVTIVEKFISA